MRLNRFFIERKNLREGSSVKLDDTDINHIRKVLRLKKGDRIILFNGEKEFLTELKLVTTDVVMAKIIEKIKDSSDSKSQVQITLFQSLLRSGKFDFIVEKATELGINSIVPVEAEFSQMKIDVAERKIDRWNKVAVAAAKQSERIDLPEITEPIKFEQIADFKEHFDLIMFFTIPRDNIASSLGSIDLKEFVKGKADIKNIAFIIGPEGGFSPKEHKLAYDWKLNFVKFGNTVLRSETAAVAILSVLKYVFN